MSLCYLKSALNVQRNTFLFRLSSFIPVKGTLANVTTILKSRKAPPLTLLPNSEVVRQYQTRNCETNFGQMGSLDSVADVDIDPNGTFKYILIEIKKGGAKKTIVRGYAWAEYHGKFLFHFFFSL